MTPYTPLPPWTWPDPAVDDPAGQAYYTKWEISFAQAKIAVEQDRTQAIWASAQLIAQAIQSLGASMSRTYISPAVSVEVLSAWKLTNITIVAGGSVDLKTTLPSTATPGGTFGVFSGTLPAGVTLDLATGVLAADAQATPGVATGLVLSYLEPAAQAAPAS